MAGAFFFKRSSSARRPLTLALDSAGSIRSNCLSWLPATFFFNRAASALRNDVISLSLAWIAAWALVVGVDLFLGRCRDLDVFGTGENARERVVIGCGNRVVLVVVAAGAGHGESQEPATQRVDAVGVLVVLLGIAVIDRPAGEKAQGRQAVRTIGPIERDRRRSVRE